MKLGENAISPMWKKHQNLPSNNNDAHNITKCGFLVPPHAQIVALRVHCIEGPPIGQVWTRHSALATPACTRPSMPSQFHACLTRQSIVTLAHWVSCPSSLTGARDKVASWFKARMLGHALVGLVLARGAHTVFHVGLCRGPHLATPLTYWHTLAWRVLGEGCGHGSSVFACVCCYHGPLSVVLVLRIENPQWVHALLELDHIAI